MMPSRFSSSVILAAALGVLAIGACRNDSPAEPALPDTQGLEGFFNPQPGEVWTYAVTRDFAPGSRLRPTEEAKAVTLPGGAKRVTFERRRICAGLEQPEGAEKNLTAFELYEDGLLAEREFYDITSAGLIGRGWTPAPEITPAVTPPPKGILLTPGVKIAVPRMVGGQSWTAPGAKAGPVFLLDVIERSTVTVPAGEFETTRIRLTTGSDKRSTKRTVWFAENIGIVKEEVAHYGPERILVKEDLVLTKWSLPENKTTAPTPPITPPPAPKPVDEPEVPEPGTPNPDELDPPSPVDDDPTPGDSNQPETTGTPDMGPDEADEALEPDDNNDDPDQDPVTPPEDENSEAPPAEEPVPPKAEIIEE